MLSNSVVGYTVELDMARFARAHSDVDTWELKPWAMSELNMRPGAVHLAGNLDVARSADLLICATGSVQISTALKVTLGDALREVRVEPVVIHDVDPLTDRPTKRGSSSDDEFWSVDTPGVLERIDVLRSDLRGGGFGDSIGAARELVFLTPDDAIPPLFRPRIGGPLACSHMVADALRNARGVKQLEPLATSRDRGVTPLMSAIRDHRRSDIARLLNASSVTAQDATGWTPLHYACRMLEPTLVADILAVGGNPNAVARRGITPLYVAAHTGDPATTELLLACGADASLRETEGYTVLHAAVYSGSIATLDVLRQGDCIAEPQSARRSLLDIAFRRRDPQMLTALLGRLRDVPDLQPLLTRAVQQYQSDMVAALLDAGASLDSCKSLVPPVVSAAMAGDAPLIRRLIALGRSPNELHDGRTPLEHLLRYERSRLSTYLEVVEVLLDSGAVLDRPSIDGGTVRSLLAEAVREQGELSTAFRAMLKRHAFD